MLTTQASNETVQPASYSNIRIIPYVCGIFVKSNRWLKGQNQAKTVDSEKIKPDQTLEMDEAPTEVLEAAKNYKTKNSK